MATYDQLSAEQRAIVDLIVKRGQTYDQLAEKLGIPAARVRELARESLVSLAPVSAADVDEDRREQLTDYLLNQQQPSEAASTRGYLRRSESARAWSRSVLDSLEHLYERGSLPTVPAGDASAEREPARTKAAARDLSPEAQAVVRRRRIVGGGVAALVLLLVVLVWPIGLLVGGGDDGDSGGDKKDAATTEMIGQVQLRPVGNVNRENAGIAIATDTDGKRELAIQAQLQPTGKGEAYEVWLYNSPKDARSLGAQVTTPQGAFAGKAVLPDDYRDYKFIDLSRERVNRDVAHSGQSVLRARMSDLKPPAAAAGSASP